MLKYARSGENVSYKVTPARRKTYVRCRKIFLLIIFLSQEAKWNLSYQGKIAFHATSVRIYRKLESIGHGFLKRETLNRAEERGPPDTFLCILIGCNFIRIKNSPNVCLTKKPKNESRNRQMPARESLKRKYRWSVIMIHIRRRMPNQQTWNQAKFHTPMRSFAPHQYVVQGNGIIHDWYRRGWVGCVWGQENHLRNARKRITVTRSNV